MELYPLQLSPWPIFIRAHYSSPANASATPENHVRWSQTPENHLYSADLPGMRREEIKVEIEDSRYMVIRTEWHDDDEAETWRRKRFMRKFRLPRMVDTEGISAGYADGVLTVTVPRSIVGGRLRINTGDLPTVRGSVAPAA